MWGGVEAGGTWFVCAVGHGPDQLVDELRFPTGTPLETLSRVAAFFRPYTLAGLGIGCFGPIDLRAGSDRFGHVTSTPKLEWIDADVVGPLQRALGCPVAFDTDVNAAALGELTWGAARGCENVVYLTVGTGIGGGVVVGGRPLHGMVHPEVGHMRVPRHPDDGYAGHCPYHGDCLEGLAAGPALAERWGQPGAELAPDHPAWDMEAFYLAQAVANLVVTVSPERVILGGGVMDQPSLLGQIQSRLPTLLGGYVRAAALADLETYLQKPQLGKRSGVLGAMALAQLARR